MTDKKLPDCPGCRRRHRTRAALLRCIDRRLNPTLLHVLLSPYDATQLGYRVSLLLRRLRATVAAYPDDGTVL